MTKFIVKPLVIVLALTTTGSQAFAQRGPGDAQAFRDVTEGGQRDAARVEMPGGCIQHLFPSRGGCQ